MAKSKRILFTFDPRSHQNLRELTDVGGFPSASDAVRDALRIARSLQDQARLGFTEVVVRNPVTNKEKVMVLPSSSLPPSADEWEPAEQNAQPQFSPAKDVAHVRGAGDRAENPIRGPHPGAARGAQDPPGLSHPPRPEPRRQSLSGGRGVTGVAARGARFSRKPPRDAPVKPGGRPHQPARSTLTWGSPSGLR